MKFLHLFPSALIFIGALMSCSEKEEEPGTSVSAEVEPVHPATNLIRQKVALEEQLNSIIAQADLDGHEDLKAAQDNARKADQHFLLVQQQHPKLRKLFQKASGWDGRKSSGSPTQRAKVAEMMKDIHTQISEISATLPEIQAARDAQAKARKQIHSTKLEIARNLPAAKEILAELADIVSQLKAQRP